MPLIECPDCRARVSSVASICPHCHSQIGSSRWSAEERITHIFCHRCGSQIPLASSICCNCGTEEPKARHPLRSPAIVASVVVAIGLTVGGWIALSNPREDQAVREPSRPMVAASVLPSAVSPDPPELRPVEVRAAPKAVVPMAETRWTTTWVNVRERPTTRAPVVGVLDPRVEIMVSDRAGSWWVAYRDGKRIGFVSNSVLAAAPR